MANYHIVNYMLMAVLLYTLIGFALQSPDWTTRWLVLRRWLVVMGALYVFRGISLVITTLPSPLFDNCQPPDAALHGSPAARFGFLFQQVGGNITPCTDNIFSGHTSVVMSCAVLWRTHSRIRPVFTWMVSTLVLATMLMILFTHFHYTVDVLLAICTCFPLLSDVYQDLPQSCVY